MKLSFEQIKGIATGAVDFEHSESGISFFRFTKEQMNAYKERVDFYSNTYSPAGVKLCFKTDSEKLYLNIETIKSNSRSFFSLDVKVDGELIGSIDNFSETEIPQRYDTIVRELGKFSKSFSLGKGVKSVSVYFPWSVYMKLIDMEIDDGAFIEAVKPQKRLFAYGDSISQGYDVLRPSAHHISMLSDAIGAEAINKAIGGERFWPELAALKDDIAPDYITVAYGTNDWRHSGDEDPQDYDKLAENCDRFIANLKKNYPDAKIFVITPLWRICEEGLNPKWPFEETEEIIRRTAEPWGVTVVRGDDLVPHDSEFFADLVLHPNDKGFECYFENLFNAIKEEL